MITYNSLSLAKRWVADEMTANRPIISYPFELHELQVLTDQDLADMVSRIPEWDFAIPHAVDYPKSRKGEYRTAHYLPVQDRLVLTAAIIESYDHIYRAIEPFNGLVNYDRPLPQSAADFAVGNHHDAYQAFKGRIWADEKKGRWIVHNDIRAFASSCRGDYVTEELRRIGMNADNAGMFARAFVAWKDGGLTGIPQGYLITDYLLKLMLVDVDRQMTDIKGVSYYRYVDDIIIAADTKEQAKDAHHKLQDILATKKLALKETEMHFAKPNETGHGHSYRPEGQIERIANTIREFRQMHPALQNDPMPTHDELVRVAYKRFMSPSNPDRENCPKYLISYLLREMRKNGMDDFVSELPALIRSYPDQAAKLLKSAIEVKDFTTVMTNVADAFFDPRLLDDKKMDGLRMDYCALLHDGSYNVSEYALISVRDGLATVAKRQELFRPFANHAAPAYQQKFGRGPERQRTPHLS